jgi:homoserine O-acetyltransferase/O-succinyltransferase
MEEHRDLWWASPTVELGKVVHLTLDEPFVADHGGELPEIQVSYESWGELNEARDNAVLIVHPMTADCHVTGEFLDQPRGWWEDLVGPGRPIDTDENWVVCPNLIGSCYGTTGPRFPAPDGDPWYGGFPLLTPRDMMRVQRLFLDELGIHHLRMVIGPSMGGMIAWEWAAEASDMVDTSVVGAAPLVTTANQIGMNWLQRRGIELDMTGDEVVAKTGQMIARGVGMLSYRSPTGLEERFGRDWFKKPGSTLAKRGMFNIESWLRFHGKRITKRFDPYTYLLFSRAMDLHDLAAGRGDLTAALSRVTCRVLVIGISSDNLYPPKDVHFGADLLKRLGGDVHYAEIRSLHGHDAFLLEIDQLGDIIQRHRADAGPRVPAAAEREEQIVRIGILGAGRVAASLVNLIEERRESIAQEHGCHVQIAALSDLDPARRLDPVFEGLTFESDPTHLVTREDVDVLVELTRGIDSAELVERFLKRRRPVVTPNKPLIRWHGEALERVASENGVRIAYHDAIAAGWPILYSVQRPLMTGSMVGIRAMLSASSNSILRRMAEGVSYDAALEEVVASELTEVDPDLDVSGWDAAQKLNILVTRALQRRHSVAADQIVGIEGIDPGLIHAARALGLCIRLVAHAQVDAGAPLATVRPMAVPLDSHLGAVRGRNHVVVLETRSEGEVVQIGQGGGTLPVATAVLNDLIGLKDPNHSWTGHFHVSAEPMGPPVYEEFFGIEAGRPVTGPTCPEGGIPLLSA